MKAAAAAASCSSVALGPARRRIQRTMPLASIWPATRSGAPTVTLATPQWATASPHTPCAPPHAITPHLPSPPAPSPRCHPTHHHHPATPPPIRTSPAFSPSPPATRPCAPAPIVASPPTGAMAIAPYRSPTGVGEGVGAVAIMEELERGVGGDAKLIGQGCLCRGIHLAQPCQARLVPQCGSCLGEGGCQPLAVPTPRRVCGQGTASAVGTVLGQLWGVPGPQGGLSEWPGHVTAA